MTGKVWLCHLEGYFKWKCVSVQPNCKNMTETHSFPSMMVILQILASSKIMQSYTHQDHLFFNTMQTLS